jgi:hypothetical protein
MGLLDIQFDPDPVKNAQFKRGLLDFGLNMLAQGNKSTGTAIGNAGLMTQQARMQRDQQAQHDERAKTQQQLLQGQVEQMQRLQQMQKLPQQFMRADKPATMDDRDVGQPGEAPLQRKFDADGYTNALMGLDPMQGLAMQAATKKQEPAPVAYGADQTVGHWDGGRFIPAFTTPSKPGSNEQPSSVREYQFAQQQGYKGTYQQFQLDMKRAGATSVTFGTGATPMQMPDGSIVLGQLSSTPGVGPQIVKGPDGKPMRPPPQDRDIRMTEAQAKAATFKSQMEFAERELAGVPIDQTKLYGQMDTVMAGGITNPIASPAAQRARQAQEQWAEAFLRFKTGAATTKDEVRANVRTFFPQPGDSAAVIEQKKRARAQAAKDLAFAAGNAKPGAEPAAAPDAVRRFNPQTGRIE